MLVIFWHGKAVGVNRRLRWNPKLKQMIPDPDYKAFKESLAWTVRAHSEIIKGQVDVRLSVCLRKGMDSDSVVKPCLDALQLGGVLANDNQVRNINVTREYHKRGEIDRIGFFITEAQENDNNTRNY